MMSMYKSAMVAMPDEVTTPPPGGGLVFTTAAIVTMHADMASAPPARATFLPILSEKPKTKRAQAAILTAPKMPDKRMLLSPGPTRSLKNCGP